MRCILQNSDMSYKLVQPIRTYFNVGIYRVNCTLRLSVDNL